jgi:glutamate--cysteine ligase
MVKLWRQAVLSGNSLTDTFQKRLGQIADHSEITISGGRKGIEKESLRVDPQGYLSQKAHPVTLGSALTNRYITTDFSEALLEFVTPAYRNTWEALRTVCDIHQFTYQNLGDELLWVSSMPCRIPADRQIPLARYGDSNVGQMKTIYRRGLGHRYGRHMQTIAGVHFNYSLPETFWSHYAELLGDTRSEDEFRSEHYLGLVRNVRRYGWILLYLFGASPALCKSFAADGETVMKSFNDDTWYEPFGTSLRMSDLGYNNQTQSRLNIRLNDIDEYIGDLSSAVRTPEPAYEKIGVKVDGEYRQLNANQLQIENEYYSSVRPKRVARSGERPTAALRRGGVEYVEIRSLDINVFDPCGINQNTMRFVEAFLVYCLLEESALFDDRGLDEARHNQLETARRGRDPALMLRNDGAETGLAEWAVGLLDGVAKVAELIDEGDAGNSYVAAVQAARDMVDDPDKTPSARILQELREANCSFFDFAFAASNSHREYFASIAGLTESRNAELRDESIESLQRQKEIEAADDISLDEYLGKYFMSRSS